MQATARSLDAPRIRIRSSTAPTRSHGTNRSTGKHLRGLRGAASQVGNWFLWIVVAGALYFGWVIRDEGYITAEAGLGYALGIIGGSLMLLLLLYPLRKRLRHWQYANRCRGQYENLASDRGRGLDRTV